MQTVIVPDSMLGVLGLQGPAPMAAALPEPWQLGPFLWSRSVSTVAPGAALIDLNDPAQRDIDPVLAQLDQVQAGTAPDIMLAITAGRLTLGSGRISPDAMRRLQTQLWWKHTRGTHTSYRRFFDGAATGYDQVQIDNSAQPAVEYASSRAGARVAPMLLVNLRTDVLHLVYEGRGAEGPLDLQVAAAAQLVSLTVWGAARNAAGLQKLPDCDDGGQRTVREARAFVVPGVSEPAP